MRVDYQHVLAFLAILLPAVATGFAGQFSVGSIGAGIVIVLVAVGLACKASVLPSVNVSAALVAANKKG